MFGRSRNPSIVLLLALATVVGTFTATPAAADTCYGTTPEGVRYSYECGFEEPGSGGTIDIGETPSEDRQVAPPPARPDGTTRFAGSDRFSTAVAVSQGSFPGTANDVFVVTGLNWPDALAAGAAAAQLDAPVLPVLSAEIPAVVLDELQRLAPVRAWIIGGEGAVSNNIRTDLEVLGLQVERVAGNSRYSTAAAVAGRFFDEPGGAYYASGAGYADALGGGAAAAHRGWPLLLTGPTSVPAETPVIGNERVVLGGPAAVSDQVVAQLRARRVFGSDRYATAAALATDAFNTSQTIYLATGLNFPDALAGAAAAARDDAPLLLATPTCVTAPTAGAMQALGAIARVALGGTTVLQDRAAAGLICPADVVEPTVVLVDIPTEATLGEPFYVRGFASTAGDASVQLKCPDGGWASASNFVKVSPATGSFTAEQTLAAVSQFLGDRTFRVTFAGEATANVPVSLPAYSEFTVTMKWREGEEPPPPTGQECIRVF